MMTNIADPFNDLYKRNIRLHSLKVSFQLYLRQLAVLAIPPES